jgi:hypothetical protein
MRDPKLIELLRQSIDLAPFDGAWKLNASEMESLSERLAEIAFDVYQRGYNEGFDACLETFREGAETLFGIKV